MIYNSIGDECVRNLSKIIMGMVESLGRNIREFEVHDIDLVLNYFLNADCAFLKAMGVDKNKLPHSDKWRQILVEDFDRLIEQKRFYYIIWELDGVPVGHSNISKIIYGKEAFMHLHLWQWENRRRGHGTYFIEESIAFYFQKFHLQNLICEPYALNPAPNRTLAKIGFEFIKVYETTPGWITFRQLVNRWMLTKEKWSQRL